MLYVIDSIISFGPSFGPYYSPSFCIYVYTYICIYTYNSKQTVNQRVVTLDTYHNLKNANNTKGYRHIVSIRALGPICKSKVILIIKPNIINNILSTIKLKCGASYEGNNCNYEGNVQEYYTHIKKCEILVEYVKNQLKEIVKNMKEILDKEINPHLIAEHQEIYDKYVNEWNWLVDTNKDWKWWWWCNNEWWHNKSCQKCNDLWHKYEDEIQIFENKRISLLKTIK